MYLLAICQNIRATLLINSFKRLGYSHFGRVEVRREAVPVRVRVRVEAAMRIEFPRERVTETSLSASTVQLPLIHVSVMNESLSRGNVI